MLTKCMNGLVIEDKLYKLIYYTDLRRASVLIETIHWTHLNKTKIIKAREIYV